MEYFVDTNRTFYPGYRRDLPLIHMTSQWDTLKLILREGFKPGYCVESITNGVETKEAAFPIISLSNMTIDNALQSQKSYGTLGIALDIAWGQENDLNPVLYLDQKSDITKEIIENFKYIRATSTNKILDIIHGDNISHDQLLTRTILKFFAHSKNYQGKLARNNILYEDAYLFGLEREWRKVIKEVTIPYFLVGENLDQKAEFNKRLSNLRFDFRLEHIKEIIVETEWEVYEAKQIIIDKYKLSEFPSGIEITINRTRHVPDE